MAGFGRVKGLAAIVALALVAAVLAAPAAEAQAPKRFFTIAAVEPKGGTTVDKEAFPAAALPEGGGYVCASPIKRAAGRSPPTCGSRARSSSRKATR